MGGEKEQKGLNVPCEVLAFHRAMLRTVPQKGNRSCHVPMAQPMSRSLPRQPWGQPGPGSSSGITQTPITCPTPTPPTSRKVTDLLL